MLQLLQSFIDAIQTSRRSCHALDPFHEDCAIVFKRGSLQDIADEGVFHKHGVHATPLCAWATGRELVEQHLGDPPHGYQMLFKRLQGLEGFRDGRRGWQDQLGVVLAAAFAQHLAGGFG